MFDRELLEKARWIVEHGADKPEVEIDYGVPLYLPIPERPPTPAPSGEIDFEVRYDT